MALVATNQRIISKLPLATVVARGTQAAPRLDAFQKHVFSLLEQSLSPRCSSSKIYAIAETKSFLGVVAASVGLLNIE